MVDAETDVRRLAARRLETQAAQTVGTLLGATSEVVPGRLRDRDTTTVRAVPSVPFLRVAETPGRVREGLVEVDGLPPVVGHTTSQATGRPMPQMPATVLVGLDSPTLVVEASSLLAEVA